MRFPIPSPIFIVVAGLIALGGVLYLQYTHAHTLVDLWPVLPALAASAAIYLCIRRVRPLYHIVLCSEKTISGSEQEPGPAIGPLLFRILIIRAKTKGDARDAAKYLVENACEFRVLGPWKPGARRDDEFVCCRDKSGQLLRFYIHCTLDTHLTWVIARYSARCQCNSLLDLADNSDPELLPVFCIVEENWPTRGGKALVAGILRLPHAR